MSDDKKPKPSYAPLYCALYPELAETFKKHGYALAVHGSLQRDFDLIAIPWIATPSDPKTIISELVNELGGKSVGEPEIREHNRLIYTISISFGECFIDLSFMPLKEDR